MSFDIRPGAVYSANHAASGEQCLVLALGAADANGRVRLAPITETQEESGSALYMEAADFTAAPLPHPCYVHTDELCKLAASELGAEVARLSSYAYEKVLRQLITQDIAQLSALRHSNAPFQRGVSAIPPSGRLVGAEEAQLMVEAALDGWLTAGRFNTAFEQQLAEFLGVRHLLTVNSGSSANLLAFSALTSPRLGNRAIQPGDEVLAVAAAFPTTVNPILQYGAVPVFVDVELGTYNVDVQQLEAAVTPRTKAVMLAHTLGNPFNLDAVSALCRKHGLWLVEDCCDALGSTYNGKPVGSFGDIATLSFYPAHHITMGEGGAVFTNNAELKLIAESFRDWGRDCYCAPACENTCGQRFDQQHGTLPRGYDHKYVYSHLGYNLKITDMQAACGVAQLAKLSQFVAQRQANFAFLKQQLAPLEEYLLLPQATPNSNPAWFGFPLTLRVAANSDRVDLLRYLDQYKIGTRLLFAGNITRQPYMQGRNFRVCGALDNTDKIMRDTFWTGVQPALPRTALEFMVEKLSAFFAF